MSSIENLTSTAVFVNSTPTTLIIDIESDPNVAAYWDAVVEVRRYWQAMKHEGPAPTYEGKMERIGRLSGYIKVAQAAAEVIGVDFTAADFM